VLPVQAHGGPGTFRRTLACCATKAAPDVDINDAARILAEQARKREDKFRDSWEAESKKEDVLNRKFEEALRKPKTSLPKSRCGISISNSASGILKKCREAFDPPFLPRSPV